MVVTRLEGHIVEIDVVGPGAPADPGTLNGALFSVKTTRYNPAKVSGTLFRGLGDVFNLAGVVLSVSGVDVVGIRGWGCRYPGLMLSVSGVEVVGIRG